MSEKKVIPLFDPSDRGGNSRSRINPQIYSIVIGNEIDHLADELSPFLQEALVREGHVAQAATEAMRLITKRTERVALPDEDRPIESATEELDWDRPDDATNLIEEID